MKIPRVLMAGVAAAACLATAGVAVSTPPSESRKPHHLYYLALGDSLSRGAQPNRSGQTLPTERGYANQIYAAEAKELKGLTFRDLGCPGETTKTMIKGGVCEYAAGSQLKAAVNFLRMHAGHIAFVTIDIGANDVDSCFDITTWSTDPSCLAKGEKDIKVNLPHIAAALRKAAGEKVRIVGMSYYDPFLAEWFAGNQGAQRAALSQQLARAVNGEIKTAYDSAGVNLAPVAARFATYKPFSDTTLLRGERIPVAVANICELTYMCASSPVGPNIHADPAGYALIATVFAEKL